MSERLNLQDLVDLLALEQGVTKKEAELFLKELFSLITENIQNLEPVKIKDFGTFKPIRVNARKSINVNTGEEFEIPSHYKLGFTPDKILRDLVNKPFAHFESVILEDGVSFDNMEEDLLESLDEINDSEENNNIIELQEDNNAIEEPEIEEQDIDEPEPEEHIDIDIVEENDVIETNTISAADISQDYQTMEINKVTDEQDNNAELADSTPIIEEEDSEEETTEIFIGEEDEEQTSDIIYNRIDNDTTNYKSNHKKMGGNTKKTVIIGAIILIGAFGFWIYSGNFEEFMVKRGFWYKVVKAPTIDTPDSAPLPATEEKSQNLQIQPDSVFSKEVIPDKKAETAIKENTVTNEAVKTPKDSPNVPETKINIESGNTLRTLGLKYFGNKSFWVYIYQENKAKIKNPNNVPIGTQLIIPSPSKYGINVKDPKSLEKAKQLEQQIYKQFGL